MRPIRFSVLAFFAVIVGLLVCLSGLGDCMARELPSIEVQKLDSEIKAKKAPFILDVREPFEVADGKIEGAVSIPLGELPARLDELPKDQDIVVYCRSGRRSGRAVSFLLDNGFTRVQNLSGGMSAWLATHSCDPKNLTC